MRAFKNERKYNIDNLSLGKAGEYRVASELLLRGHTVYSPSVDNGIDLFIENGKRIQIKCGHCQEYKKSKLNIYRFNFHKQHKMPNGKIHITPHALDVDFVICWAINDDLFYIIPADKIRGKSEVSFTADKDTRTQIKWNEWTPYLNAWGILNGEKIEDIKSTEPIQCVQCGFSWIPLTPNPTRCPSCNGRWKIKMYDFECSLCHKKWHTKLEHPVRCHFCGCRTWDKEQPINTHEPITCSKCNYTWKPEVDKPERCPHCGRRTYADFKKKGQIIMNGIINSDNGIMNNSDLIVA